MSLRSEAEAEAEKRFPTPPRCSDEERGIAYLQRTEFVAGVEWLADRLLSGEAVERAAQAQLDSERARHDLPPVPLDTLPNAEEWIEDARDGLTAALGEES